MILTGAGISAESGVATFRDAGGLWEGHNVMDVASPQGWERNPKLVLDFYNQRRAQLKYVKPNIGHTVIADLEQHFDVRVITQNVDDLHERAGSTQVLHLHGELLKVRSTKNQNEILHWEHDLTGEDTDSAGNPLRPHIVWFGEEVPALEEAISIAQQADIFLVVGTSLQVYPAAGLSSFTKPGVPLFYVDPNPAPIYDSNGPVEIIAMNATSGMLVLREKLLAMR